MATKNVRETLKGNVLFLKGNWKGRRIGPLPPEVSGRLTVSDTAGWVTDGDLSFLETADGLKDLKVISHKRVDLSPLSSLHGIANLVLRLPQNASQAFDFETLPFLVELDIDWNGGFHGIWQHPSISMLTIDGIKGVSEVDVSLMKGLKQICLRSTSSLRSLNLGDQRLEKLSLHHLPKLSEVLGRNYLESVCHLSVTGLGAMEGDWFHAFRALRVVEVGMKDQISRDNFDCFLPHFLRMP
jgi:hypothetical protein